MAFVIDDRLKEQLEKRIQCVSPDDMFLEYVLPYLENENNLAKKNRDQYFGTERLLLALSCINAVLGAINSSRLFDDIVVTFLGISIAFLSALSAFFIGLRGLQKWQETWLRHRGFFNQCIMIFRRYASYTGEYEAYKLDTCKTDQENKELEATYEREKWKCFKMTVLNLMEQNNEQFMKNMVKKD